MTSLISKPIIFLSGKYGDIANNNPPYPQPISTKSTPFYNFPLNLSSTFSGYVNG